MGCTVLEMLTASRPWSEYSNPITAMYYIASPHTMPKLPDNLSDMCLNFIHTCLQKDSDARPDVSRLLFHPFVSGLPPPLVLLYICLC